MVMATSWNPPLSSAPIVGSYETALCIIPPTNLHARVDGLRALYDKAHGRWPPHINFIYPFVSVESLPYATDLIQSKLRELGTNYQKINLHMDISDYFSHRHSNTVFIAPSQDGVESLKALRNSILSVLKSGKNEQEYHPHLTIGQTPANAPPMLEYLLDKARLLLPIAWQVEQLVVLVRDKMPRNGNSKSCMRVWDSIDLYQDTMQSTNKKGLCEQQRSHPASKEVGLPTTIHQPAQALRSYGAQRTSSATPRNTYYFSTKNAIWRPVDPSIPLPTPEQIPSSFRVSSYNVLHDPSITISTDERYPVLLKSILDDCALSDVLILQEVTDDLLSYLLSNNTISSHYPFATHAPINPLPSLRNIVVLCRWNFSWEYLSVGHRHKGAAIVQFSNVGMSEGGSWEPLILVGVHLSSGLSNTGVAARKSQIQALLGHLSEWYPSNPWIIAGDFNITTSPAAIEDAVAMKVISAETANISDNLLPMFDEKGLVDAWIATGDDNEEDAYGGDAGATFDPVKNPLAAETVRNAGSKNMQPRRYDRIFVKGGNLFEVTEFNMFGLMETTETTDWKQKHLEITPHSASDHYGIRATFSTSSFASVDTGKLSTIGTQPSTIKLYDAPPNLSDQSVLNECLINYSAFLSEAQSHHYKDILGLLNTILQSPTSQSTFSPTSIPQPIIILLPVGSYALGACLSNSDLDILALSTFSASLFFDEATQRLQNFKELGVKILRRVDAATGTMLELEIKGVRCDLQYCCAPAILPG
jgi:endonuclease/exonuclease/phosphatase family metal-dependent hydrolase/2'-5' RNA ligase